MVRGTDRLETTALLSILLTSCLISCSTAPLPGPEVPQTTISPTLADDTGSPAFPFLDADLSLDTRVDDILERMTLEEKISQTLYESPAIERLGIPEYNWWNEALHGVARAGIATVFPQAIGLAATWDPELLFRVATVISDEARAKHHEAVRQGSRDIYEGLTFWSPNINIFRDPRWGRGMETYGEDPYLAGELAVSFVKGMQGDDPFYLKTVATPKHFAVHSGPEPDRHTFDAVVSERDLRETYLPAFRASIVEGGAESVMCAYNRFRGDPACGSPELLQQILREEWGFEGYVVSDCWAIADIYNMHRVVETPVEAAAMAMAAGTDLNCGVTFNHLGEAIRSGLLSEDALDVAVRRLLRARFRLGMFDPPDRVPWADIPYSVNDSPEHGALALETARASIVLLKNEGGLLPLNREVGTIVVIGPNADDIEVLLGNYNGTPSDPVTPLRGIMEKVSPGTRVLHARGSDLTEGDPEQMGEALRIAEEAEVVILILGISPRLEGEALEVEIPGFLGGDRVELDLPAPQQELMREVVATGKPVVMILLNGSALAIPWGAEHVPAILEAWYPGQAAGSALADVLFGDYNPAGRLPVTVYRSAEDLPPFSDYRMEGRTYKYFRGDPLFPFGHGLSYTTFTYGHLEIPAGVEAGEEVEISVTVGNTGAMAGDEVVQLYVTDMEASVPVPIRSLQGVQRIHLEAGAIQRVTFTLTPRQLSIITDDGERIIEPGTFEVSVGGKQPGFSGVGDSATTDVVVAQFEVVGTGLRVER